MDDLDAYKAAVSRRRKKRLHFRMDLLNPIYTMDFESASVSNFLADHETLAFNGPVTVLSGPVSGQTAEQPGAIALKQFSNKTKLGFWLAAPITISRVVPFKLQAVDISNGNYNNLLLDLTAYDASNVVVYSQSFFSSPGTPQTITPVNLTIPIAKFTVTRNPASAETRHPNAVGTVIVIGGRPRPPVYTKSIFIADIKYKL